MLQPNKDRLDYGNLLMPPEGFQLDNAIATTYLLDLDALISIPVALYFAHSLDLNVNQDIVQVLDSIRRAGENVKVFCQKGQIKVPENQHRLYSFIEPCIVQIPPTHKNSFHPKVWILRYENNADEIRYRVIVLSRNLTFDRSWDVAFQLEGECIKDRKNNFSKTKPLIDFINYLSEYEKPNWFKRFISDLGKTKFQLSSNEFDDFRFHPTGFNGYQKNIDFDNDLHDELLIISPFVTKGGLELAKNSSRTKPTLFSRENELKKLNQDILKHFSVYHLANDYVEGEEKLETDTEENILNQQQDLHAKIYSYKDGWNAYLLLGSANCSERAMHSNVEFMIKLIGKNSKIGPDTIFKELINDDLKVFDKYKPTELLSEQEKELLKREEELQRIKIDITNSQLKAKAIQQDDSNYSVEFDLNLTKVSSKSKIEAVAYMLNNSGQTQKLTLDVENSWTIKNISELDLSCFLIIDLKIKNADASLKFAMKVSILNLPKTRNTKIFRDIISNTANFFKYIRFLLAENYWDEELAFNETNGKFKNGNRFDIFFNHNEPIYENMLKAVSREPQKLTEIRKVIEKISEEENKEQPIIPEDFRNLWNVFEEAQKNKKSK